MAITKSLIIDVDVKGEDELKSLDKSIDGVGESVGGVNTQLDGMGGAAGAAVKGVKSLGLAFKALLANPIVLVITGVVGALVGLYNAFKRTAVGGDAISKVFDGIANSIGPVLDSLGKLATGLVEFFKGNFAEGIDQMKTSFDGLGQAIADTFEQSARLVEINRELHNLNLQITKDEAKTSLELTKQRVILEDLSKSATERLEASNKVFELNEELQAQTLKRIALQKEEAELNLLIAGEDDEAVQEAELRLAQLEAEEYRAAERKFNLIKRVQNFTRQINKEIADQNLLTQREENDTSLSLTSEKIDNIQLEGEREIEVLQGLANQKIEINKQIDEANQNSLENEQKITQARLLMAAQLVSLSANALGFINSQIEEGTKAKKAAAVAGIALDVAAGFMNGLIIAGESAKATGPAAAFAFPIFYATQVLAVLTAATKAKDVLNTVPVGGSSPSVSAPSMPTSGGVPSFNTIGGSGFNQIEDAINGQNDTPIQAYVIGNDVTTQQALDRNITNTASFG